MPNPLAVRFREAIQHPAPEDKRRVEEEEKRLTTPFKTQTTKQIAGLRTAAVRTKDPELRADLIEISDELKNLLPAVSEAVKELLARPDNLTAKETLSKLKSEADVLGRDIRELFPQDRDVKNTSEAISQSLKKLINDLTPSPSPVELPTSDKPSTPAPSPTPSADDFAKEAGKGLMKKAAIAREMADDMEGGLMKSELEEVAIR